jgi:hypothetical protein
MSYKTALLVCVAFTIGTVMLGYKGKPMKMTVWGEDGVLLQGKTSEDLLGFSELGEALERASFAPNSTHIATVQDNAKRKDCAPEQTNDTHSLNQTKPQEVPNKGRLKESKQHNVVQATSSYTPSPKKHTEVAPNTSHGQNRTSIQCTEPPCLQYLSEGEKKTFTWCQRKTPTFKSTKKAPKCKCKFRERTGKKRVALNSLPGSGNTWLRGLLERATGLCTGSMWCDPALFEGGFCGEGMQGTSLVAVKIHDSSLQWKGGKVVKPHKPVFDKAIFLIRNPFQANIAEWNRQMSEKHAPNQTGSNHVKYVTNKTFFGENKDWHTLVKHQTHRWSRMIANHVKAHEAGRPVLVVFFEDLKVDPAPQLARMLQFLEMPSSPDIINATLMNDYTTYYRNHTDNFEHYTAEQKIFINDIILQAANATQGKFDEDMVSHIREYYFQV